MLESTRELSAPVTARSRGAATGISGAGNTGAGNEGGGRAASRSSRNSSILPLSRWRPSKPSRQCPGGRSSGRPAAAEAIRRRRTGAQENRSQGAARRADGGRTAGATRFAGRPAGMLQK
ncbi:hypothetical protein NP493_145g01000 [Ridgeia piscesae]|uniref:Uncharacterized protein n=1 Tax=Ridgeia piscesae TaxID=27915 RepID=A0AAD9P4M5_RIDPI|nr:hypothetical protein NP493_145g01000 [Ridgeia piscesae]